MRERFRAPGNDTCRSPKIIVLLRDRSELQSVLDKLNVFALTPTDLYYEYHGFEVASQNRCFVAAAVEAMRPIVPFRADLVSLGLQVSPGGDNDAVLYVVLVNEYEVHNAKNTIERAVRAFAKSERKQCEFVSSENRSTTRYANTRASR